MLVNGSTFKAEAFEVELSAVQPPHNPKGAALQTCFPTAPLKTASPSSHQAPHHYVGGHISGHRGKVRRGQVRKCMATGGDNLTLERGNKYSKVPLSAKAVTGASFSPESPHQHKNIRDQIPIIPSVVNFCSVK